MPPTEDDQTPVQKPNMAAEDLRQAIDRGDTGEKIPAADPAAAPLGTDDEAAGTRPSAELAPAKPVPPWQRAPKGHEKGGDTFES
jgi:hypothetical protein